MHSLATRAPRSLNCVCASARTRLGPRGRLAPSTTNESTCCVRWQPLKRKLFARARTTKTQIQFALGRREGPISARVRHSHYTSNCHHHQLKRAPDYQANHPIFVHNFRALTHNAIDFTQCARELTIDLILFATLFARPPICSLHSTQFACLLARPLARSLTTRATGRLTKRPKQIIINVESAYRAEIRRRLGRWTLLAISHACPAARACLPSNQIGILVYRFYCYFEPCYQRHLAARLLIEVSLTLCKMQNAFGFCPPK